MRGAIDPAVDPLRRPVWNSRLRLQGHPQLGVSAPGMRSPRPPDAVDPAEKLSARRRQRIALQHFLDPRLTPTRHADANRARRRSAKARDRIGHRHLCGNPGAGARCESRLRRWSPARPRSSTAVQNRRQLKPAPRTLCNNCDDGRRMKCRRGGSARRPAARSICDTYSSAASRSISAARRRRFSVARANVSARPRNSPMVRGDVEAPDEHRDFWRSIRLSLLMDQLDGHGVDARMSLVFP